jgi:hypothetical protein
MTKTLIDSRTECKSSILFAPFCDVLGDRMNLTQLSYFAYYY